MAIGRCASVIALCCGLLLLLSTANAQIGAGTASDPAYYYADTYYMGNAGFRTYIAVDHDNERPVAMGIEFSAAFFLDTPKPTKDLAEFTIELPLHTIGGVYTQFAGFESNWVPLGHPNSPYERPHMDFHFYMMNKAAREENILPGDCLGVDAKSLCKVAKPFHPECMPPGYIQPGIPVPYMGGHMIDVTGPEMSGGKFLDTFVFGNWDSRIIFYEPMIALESFEALMNGTWSGQRCLPIRNPAYHKVGGYYPSRFCYYYMTTGNIRVEMLDWVHIPTGCEGQPEFGGPGSFYPGGDTVSTKAQKKKCDDCKWYSYAKNLPAQPTS